MERVERKGWSEGDGGEERIMEELGEVKMVREWGGGQKRPGRNLTWSSSHDRQASATTENFLLGYCLGHLAALWLTLRIPG